MEYPTAEQDHVIPPTSDLSGEAPTVAINTGLLPTASQHCTRCGASLAADQRYCVECGERRGEPRLPFMDGRTTSAAAAGAAPAVALVETTTTGAARRSRFSPSSTLVAGTATLVLALGVGVLIGNAGKDGNATAAAPPVQVVTVAGGGGTAAPATTTAADATGGTTTTAAKKGAKDSAAKATASKSAAQKAAAAKKVSAPTGDAIPEAKTPVVKKGSKGSGPGYKNGEFTGDFFGG
jgi:hypothetical protein